MATLRVSFRLESNHGTFDQSCEMIDVPFHALSEANIINELRPYVGSLLNLGKKAKEPNNG